MNVTIKAGRAAGSLQAPPSKSDAHRALICAALSAGTSTVRGIAESQDLLATLDCIGSLGANVTLENGTAKVTGKANPGSDSFPCRESGSTLRFFLPLCLLRGTLCRLSGSPRLLERPMDVYRQICREQGLQYDKKEDSIVVCGGLTPGKYTVSGSISSQFVTGLLFALPLLPGDSTLQIQPPFVSRPYVEMTLQTLSRFGIRVEEPDPLTFVIPGGQAYRPTDYTVEGDWSNAAFYEALNLLGGKVTVEGLNPASRQGDRIYRSLFPKFPLEHPVINLENCPDLAPVFMALGAAFNGVTLQNTGRLSAKESDRGSAMAQELAKFGISCKLEENTVTVLKGELQKPKTAIFGQNDHRVVMACATLLTLTGGEIVGAEAVAKSNPAYFDDLQKLGIGVTVYGTDNR